MVLQYVILQPNKRCLMLQTQFSLDELLAFRKAILSGLSAGALAQFFASPTDLVKVRMQMEGIRRLEGKPPRSVTATRSK